MDRTYRHGGLDSLRGAAVIAVLIWHYLNNTSVLLVPALSFLQDVTSHFFFGVDMFFVLSGFLIGGALMESRERLDYFSRYAVRRISRIFPLYFAWLAIFLLIIAFGAGHRGGALPWLFALDGTPVWSFLTFTQNLYSAELGTWGPMWLGVTWTLAIEVHFYVLVAILVYLVPARWMGLAALAMIVLATRLQLWGWTHISGHAVMVLTPMRLDSPFAGVLCAWLWRNEALRAFVGRYSPMVKCAGLAVIAAGYAGMLPAVIAPLFQLITPNAFFFGVAALSFAGPGGLAPFWPVRFLRWCGVRCYALYLFHVGVLGIVSHLIFNWSPNVFPPGVGWPAVLVALPITFGLTAASWRYFERPIMQWAAAQGTRTDYDLERQAAAAGPAE